MCVYSRSKVEQVESIVSLKQISRSVEVYLTLRQDRVKRSFCLPSRSTNLSLQYSIEIAQNYILSSSITSYQHFLRITWIFFIQEINCFRMINTYYQEVKVKIKTQ